MELRRLGATDLSVTKICLGTMTWGQQNSEAEAWEQLDYAIAQGINFIDTAELYAVPPRRETQGLTETYIGNWLKARGGRDKLIIATKVVGRSVMDWFRPWEGQARLDRRNIEYAIEQSLRRLQTDYIDLYQLHWPDRHTNVFGKIGYEHDANDQPVPLEETLGVLADLVKAGKIRHIGLSNENPWGVMRSLELHRHHGLPRVQTVQNAYSLLNRVYETTLAEIGIREQVGLLAYSPLAMGLLTGKYENGARPANARLTLFDRFTRYLAPEAVGFAQAYVDLARKHGLDPAQMALAWVQARPFVDSCIIGATSMEQLKADIASAELTLSDEVNKAIDAIHEARPNPCP